MGMGCALGVKASSVGDEDLHLENDRERDCRINTPCGQNERDHRRERSGEVGLLPSEGEQQGGRMGQSQAGPGLAHPLPIKLVLLGRSGEGSTVLV